MHFQAKMGCLEEFQPDDVYPQLVENNTITPLLTIYAIERCVVETWPYHDDSDY